MRNIEGGPRTGRVGRARLLREKREGILDLRTLKWPELLNILPLGITPAADGGKERGRRASEREVVEEGWDLLCDEGLLAKEKLRCLLSGRRFGLGPGAGRGFIPLPEFELVESQYTCRLTPDRPGMTGRYRGVR